MTIKTAFPAAFLVLTAACTKTETLPVPDRPGNRIVSYTINSVPEGVSPVIGAVDEADSSITVYLSAYYGLTAMTPEITIPTGATITPASGTTVTNLLSMMRKDSTITYVVTAKDGSQKQYTLHVRALQPATKIDEISPSADKPKDLTIYPKYGANGYGVVALKGNHLMVDNRATLTRVTFTDSASKVIDIPYSTEGASTSLIPTVMNYRIYPNNTELLGKLVNNAVYYVTVYNYGQVVKLQYPIRFRIAN